MDKVVPLERVVITGMGVVSPIGNCLESFSRALKNGDVGIGPVLSEGESAVALPRGSSAQSVQLAAQVKGYDPEIDIPKKEIKRLDKFSLYALSAAAQAMRQAGLAGEHCALLQNVDKNRMGVIIASGMGGMETFEVEVTKFHEKGRTRIAPLVIPMVTANMAAGNVALAYGAKGICYGIVSACASSAHAIGEAFRSIKHGYSDVILAGGSEAAITPAGVAAFNALKAMSRSTDPLRASIPFDKERDGFVIGEGAGVLVLESLSHALARGASVLAEVAGYGANCDAFHMTAPAAGGEGAALCMELALREAGIKPSDVDYINAHGTSTQLNDAAETLAVKAVFGEHASNLFVSSTKSQMGHLLGAAGAVEAIAAVVGITEGFAPPTAGYKIPDPECDLNYVVDGSVSLDINYALSNNFGFGGHNAVLCFKRWCG